jgi:beta-glucoside operon transcriptional antiterminator
MRIKKIFNNNIVLAENKQQLEFILLGKGIAYQKHKNDFINEKNAEKIFVLNSPSISNQFIELLREVPINHVELSNKIIRDAEEKLGVQFNDSIYIALADHINYSLTRYKNGQKLKNILLWEIRKFYKKEYDQAIEALNTIEYYEGIKLEEDEAGFIALHFVNAQQDGEEMQQTIIATEAVEEILKIVRFHYGIEIDDSSLNYNRFITHIRYFVKRLFKKELCHEEDNFLYNEIKEKYPQAYDCSCKVSNYIFKKFNIVLTHEEMLYFMLHINRVTQREKV